MVNSDRVDTTEIEEDLPSSRVAKVVAIDTNQVFAVDNVNNDNNFRMDVVFHDMVYEAIGSFDGIKGFVNPINPYDNFRMDNFQDATTNIVVVKI